MPQYKEFNIYKYTGLSYKCIECINVYVFQTVNGLPFLEGLPPGLPPFVFENPIHYIILDFSGISFTDTVGCKVLKQVRYLCHEIYIRLKTHRHK